MTSSVHVAASKGYASAADIYVAGRPGYPPDVAAWLCEVIGLKTGRTVLDLGSGTGKFLPLLRATGARLIAVEPVPAMRAQLAERNAGAEVQAGTAEDLPLADASVDAVICAQSFHWFANTAALAEIRRVLVPGGVLGLIWNVRDESVDWVAELSRVTDPYGGDAPRYRSGHWRHLFPADGFVSLGERHARNDHVGPPRQVIIDRTLSVSFIAALPPAQRDRVTQDVKALIARTPVLAGREVVAFPYETAMFAFRRTD